MYLPISPIVHLALTDVTYCGTEMKKTFVNKDSGFCFWQLGLIMTWNQSLLRVHCANSRTAQLSKHSEDST